MSNIPAIILVDPQMGENIGATARAMLNCGLTDLRLVRPRDGWPNEKAYVMSSGALDKMPDPQVFESVAEAIADCHFVLATTARQRDMIKPVFTARSGAEELYQQSLTGKKTAFMFGAERAGLHNDDVAQSHGIIKIPLNPDFTSLNLGQAVLLLAYEWYQTQDDTPARQLPTGDSGPVAHDTLVNLFERLEDELENKNFFHTGGHKPIMIRNLRNLFIRAEITDQEARTFHGIISALIGKKTG